METAQHEKVLSKIEFNQFSVSMNGSQHCAHSLLDHKVMAPLHHFGGVPLVQQRQRGRQ